MKKLIVKNTALLFIFLMLGSVTFAQRVIKGTVYLNGEPASGITVEAHKSSDSYFTGFDGKYELKADEKTKYIKFSFLDDVKKLDIEGNTSNVFDFYFDGVKPEGLAAGGVILKSNEELIKEGDRDYLNNLSLYDQFFKQNDYTSAYPHWKLLYSTYPKSRENIYRRGAEIYGAFVENATTKAEKLRYIDTIMMVYDQRIKYFGDSKEGFILGRKLHDFLFYKKDLDKTEEEIINDLKTAYEMGEKSIELAGEDSELAVLFMHFTNVARLFQFNQFGKDKVVETYGEIGALADKIGANAKTDKEKAGYATVKEKIEQVFQSSGAADCEALISIYTRKFDEVSNDVEALKKMLRMLNRQGCDNSDIYTRASERLYNLEPSAEAAYNMAKMFFMKDETAKAKEYFLKAIDEETDQVQVATYYDQLARVLYKEKSFSEARKYARNAINANPMGSTYSLIGLIYASAAKSFSDDTFIRSTVFWLAVDYFQKAKKADTTITGEANRLINTYSGYFPGAEDAFFRGLKNGDIYKIEGWIDETTTVRTKK